jgi:TPR repeat protein
MILQEKLFQKGFLLLSITLCFLFSPDNAIAENGILLETARKYYYGVGVSKNINKAFKLYLKAAKQGNVDGMFIVGGLYMQGHGTTVDQREAFKWLYQAAIKGRSSKESQRILGQFFLSGNNVPQNYIEALHWDELAAMGGDAEAQSELAFLYFTGKFVGKDYEKAKYWFDIAARNGYPLAQYNMGILWYTGNGVSGVDILKAYAWFNIAAANGHPSGTAAKSFLETVLSTEELIEAQKYSMELYHKISPVNQ